LSEQNLDKIINFVAKFIPYSDFVYVNKEGIETSSNTFIADKEN